MAISFDQHRDEIADLCRTYGIERLEAFGSGGTEEMVCTTILGIWYQIESVSDGNWDGRPFAV
jgi:hypothetical protein